MNRFFIALSMVMISFKILAQQTGELSGRLKNKKNNPIEFANLVLLNSNDSSLVKASLSDENGNYLFEHIAAGNYLLMASMVGYQKYSAPLVVLGINTTLPEITMESGSVNLTEANIVGLKPLVEHHIDRTVVNVENTSINAGSSAIEILKRSPGITVDQNGKVSLKGKQDVLILIDNKPTYLSSSDLANMLKNMQADELSKIEIMTNPPARYDAAGNAGVINIRLRKKQNLGFNGSLNGSYGQGIYPDFSTGIALNYRKEKFNVYGSYNYGQRFSFEKNQLIRLFSSDSLTSEFDQHTIDKTKNDEHHGRAGIDYFINSRHTLGLVVKGNFDQSDDRTISTTDIRNNREAVDSGYTTINKSIGHWNNYSINLNHQYIIDSTGRELTADVDYAQYNNRENFNFQTDYFSTLPGYVPYTEIERNNQPATIAIQSAKIDYSQTIFKKLKLDAGLKGSYVVTDNDVHYYVMENNQEITDTTRTNHFKYKEQILAAYSSVQGKFGKWGLQAGLRVEQTIAKGEQYTTSQNFAKNYIQFFPSVFVTYQINDKNLVGLNYSRRIDRPAYEDLNPFRHFLDPRTYEQGNPDLQPQLTHSFECSYTFMDALSATVNYSRTYDAIVKISNQIDSNRTTYVTEDNINSNDNYSLSLNLPYQVTKWWLTSNSLVFFNNRFEGVIDGNYFDKQLNSYLFNTYNSFTLGKGWSLELSAFYNSKMIWATFLIDPQYAVSGGISKSFLHDRLNLKIALNDIFKTEKTQAYVVYNNVNLDFSQTEDSRYIRFHITWNFGKQTVTAARKRSSSAEDEQNRIKTGK